jgi:hypothetical protein
MVENLTVRKLREVSHIEFEHYMPDGSWDTQERSFMALRDKSSFITDKYD